MIDEVNEFVRLPREDRREWCAEKLGWDAEENNFDKDAIRAKLSVAGGATSGVVYTRFELYVGVMTPEGRLLSRRFNTNSIEML